MTTTTPGTSRTARLLALMTKGDKAFNARDFAAVDAVHHPDMVAYITGLAEPVYGRKAHAAAMQQILQVFPDMHVNTPYPIQFGGGDWITVVTTVTGTFTGQMTLPDGTVIPPTGKAFDVEFGQTTKWHAVQLIVIPSFWDAALNGGRAASPSSDGPPPARGRPTGCREPAGRTPSGKRRPEPGRHPLPGPIRGTRPERGSA